MNLYPNCSCCSSFMDWINVLGTKLNINGQFSWSIPISIFYRRSLILPNNFWNLRWNENFKALVIIQLIVSIGTLHQKWCFSLRIFSVNVTKSAEHASKSKARPNFQKTNISYPLIRTRTCAYQEVRNVCFSEILACFAFLKHLFWDSPFCLITDEILDQENGSNYFAKTQTSWACERTGQRTFDIYINKRDFIKLIFNSFSYVFDAEVTLMDIINSNYSSIRKDTR